VAAVRVAGVRVVVGEAIAAAVAAVLLVEMAAAAVAAVLLVEMAAAEVVRVVVVRVVVAGEEIVTSTRKPLREWPRCGKRCRSFDSPQSQVLAKFWIRGRLAA
jgi:hypothetical protein